MLQPKFETPSLIGGKHLGYVVVTVTALGCSSAGSQHGAYDAGARLSASSDGGSGATDERSAFSCTASEPAADMVFVAASSFAMGCATSDTACKDNEKPLHTVSLSAFSIDRTEVTQAAYTACVQAKACDPPTCAWDCAQADVPAHCVVRADADAYCTWVGKRLPTEAEWEKAARGTDGRIYPWGSGAPDCTLVNMSGCDGHLSPVGSRATGASPYGALDMEGNAVEIVADWYDETFYQSSPSNDPKGPATGNRYVGRGGGYRSDPVWQRASERDWYDLTDASESLGFRCVR